MENTKKISKSAALGKFYSPRMTTIKKPGDIVLTPHGMLQVQSDGSLKPYKRD